MSVQEQIDSDLKTALLGGDKVTAEALRTIKSNLLNEAISSGVRDSGLSDEDAQKVLAKEAKKRAEAAELYQNAGEQERADKELSEKKLIEKYLPAQLDESEVAKIVDEEIAKAGSPTIQDMGRIIGAVRARAGGTANGGTIARLVKEKLSQ